MWSVDGNDRNHKDNDNDTYAYAYIHTYKRTYIALYTVHVRTKMHKLLLTACTLLLCATRGSAQACAAPNSSVALSSTASAILNSSSPPQLYLTSSGRNRSYYIQLPTGYTPNQAYPLVLGFHGSQSIGLYFPLDTKMDDARYSNNKIMVYPDGVGGSWAGPSYHNGTSVDEDIQFVADVIANVKAQFCVDAERVFGVG